MVEDARPRNDPNAPLVRFCVALEQHRRTTEGRVRTASHFLSFFFPIEDGVPNDRVFLHMPKEVRGPVLSRWGIRGAKAALRDDDAKVASVVSDALTAGDLDADSFESALAPELLLGWVPLPSFWTFWRTGTIEKPTLLCALCSAYELGLLDGHAFFETLRTRDGGQRGTDVLGNSLNKDDLVEWIRKVHVAGDASPKAMLEAVGWEKIVQKAPTESLLGVLDALAARLALAPPAESVGVAETANVGDQADGRTPAGAAVAIESTPPPVASPARKAPPVPSELMDPNGYEDEAEETRLYRPPQIQRR